MNPPRWGLGRKPSPPDERDYKLADYLRPALGVSALSWQHGPILDQGASPTCVGHGGAAWGDCLPVDDNWGGDVALALYAECKAIDGDAQDGSTVRSLAKVLKARGRLSKYAFGTLAEARTFLLAQGPVILGIDWTEDMFMPDGSGVVHAWVPVAGGHCLLAFGADESYCYLQNSWGTAWGTHGCCKISWADLAKVFAGGGEACAAVELPVSAPPLPPTPPTPTPDAKGCLTAALGLLTALKYNSKKLKAAIVKLRELEGML